MSVFRFSASAYYPGAVFFDVQFLECCWTLYLLSTVFTTIYATDIGVYVDEHRIFEALPEGSIPDRRDGKVILIVGWMTLLVKAARNLAFIQQSI